MRRYWKPVMALVLAAVILMGVWMAFRPRGTEGAKEIQVLVVFEEDNEKRFDIQTEAAYLGEALKEQALIEGEDGPYGMFITTVDGIEADAGQQQWWCITKAGERVDTGVDETPITDGEQFEITLTTGY